MTPDNALLTEFRRAWMTWFACPRCRNRSLFPRVGAEIAPNQRSARVLYRCPSCGGVSERKRPGLAALRALGFGVLTFPVIYWILLQGFSAWTIPAVIGALVVSLVLSIAADALTSDYVATEHREP